MVFIKTGIEPDEYSSGFFMEMNIEFFFVGEVSISVI